MSLSTSQKVNFFASTNLSRRLEILLAVDLFGERWYGGLSFFLHIMSPMCFFSVAVQNGGFSDLKVCENLSTSLEHFKFCSFLWNIFDVYLKTS